MATSGSPRSSNDKVDGRFYLQTDPDLEEKKNLSKNANRSFADIISTQKSRRAIGDDIKDKCENHGEKLKELYCRDHKEFLCTICVALDHRHCDIGYIPDLSEHIFDSQEYKAFKHSLELFAKILGRIKSTANQNTTKSESEANDALTKIQTFRKEINDYLDEKEKRVIDEIRRIKTEDQESIKTLVEQCDILSREIQNLNQGLTDKENQNLKCQLFVEMQTHTLAQTLDKYRNEISKLSYMNRVRQMEFVPSPELEELTNKQCDIGVASDYRYGFKTVDLSQRVRPILSIEYISDGICVVRETDGDLTLINTNLQKVISRKKPERVSFFKELSNAFSDGGSYITNVSENGIAVIVQNGIDIYSTTNGLRFQKTIKLSPKNKLLALAYANNKFVVAIDTSPPNICIVDMRGLVSSQKFPDIKDDRNLFKKPQFLAVNPDQTLIYVSDQGMNTLTCLTITGEIRASHKSKWTPRGVAVSRDGTVYVCSNANIRVFSSDLQEIGVIHGKRHGLTCPRGLAYCSKEHTLCVMSGSGWKNVVILNL